jgi:hypothetical protein
MAVACDSVYVKLVRIDSASQRQNLCLLTTNEEGAEAIISATHSTQPSLSANTNPKIMEFPSPGRSTPS